MDYISRDELRKHLADCMTAEFFDSDMKKLLLGLMYTLRICQPQTYNL